MQSYNQSIYLDALKEIEVFIKREDLLHSVISGNKYRKLKYNLLEARKLQQNILLSFGGAFSNHIAAVAGAGKEYGFTTIGIIRGEELEEKISENPTLRFAQECGMELKFISRTYYREKNTGTFIDRLKQQYGGFYLIPEGGTNELAIKGCEEILTKEDYKYNYVCVPVGTCGTIVGLINSAKENQKILGFPALKGNFLSAEIQQLNPNKNNWQLLNEYHFGGYGKINDDLISFINQFKQKTAIQLDPIYTGKMLYGIVDLASKNYFEKESKILIIHTGGLQGIEGINNKLKRQNKPVIKIT